MSYVQTYPDPTQFSSGWPDFMAGDADVDSLHGSSSSFLDLAIRRSVPEGRQETTTWSRGRHPDESERIGHFFAYLSESPAISPMIGLTSDDSPSAGDAQPFRASSPWEGAVGLEALAVIRDFRFLADGWDGEGSLGPMEGVVNDALEVAQRWPADLAELEPVLSSDGHIVLELYDNAGFALGGIELIGSHRGVYTIVVDVRVVASGNFDARATGEILGAVKTIWQALQP